MFGDKYFQQFYRQVPFQRQVVASNCNFWLCNKWILGQYTCACIHSWNGIQAPENDFLLHEPKEDCNGCNLSVDFRLDKCPL